jgi:hypothetical protein
LFLVLILFYNRRGGHNNVVISKLQILQESEKCISPQ